MTQASDAIIIGGGIIGCAVAYELAKAKVKVTLLERDEVGLSGATYASAGMLEPLSGSVAKEPLRTLGLESFRLWFPLLKELSQDSFQVDYVPRGRFILAMTDEEVERLKERLERQRPLGLALRWLSAKEALRLEPLLSPEVKGAILSDEEHQVSAPRAAEALKRAALRLGAQVREHTQVTGITRRGSRVTGVETVAGPIAGGCVVVAAGSWSALLSDSAGIVIPMVPARGQVLYLHGLPGPVRHSIDGPGGYLVPKGEFLLAGTTVERVGFDQRVTAGGTLSILQAVSRFLPSVASATIHHTRAGLRPGTPDDLPILGPVPGIDGLIMATGHFRAGILLAPVTARLVAGCVMGKPDRKALRPYVIDRFLKEKK